MDSFLRNAQEIFDVARADRSGDHTDFALLIRPDGGLHLIMGAPFTLEAAAAHEGARVAYRVTRTSTGVRVVGQNAGQTCVLQENGADVFRKNALSDQAHYSVISRPLISSGIC